MHMSSMQYFNEVATRWDSMRKSFFPDSVRETAYREAKIEAGKIAADIGAGTGFITSGLLAAGVRVIAVDQSTEMLAQLQKKLGTDSGLDCRAGSAEELPIDSGSVDYVFANMFLHHVEDPPAAIREMARILKPGGRVVVTDLDSHTFEFLRTEQHDRWMGFRREDVQRWFADAGLETVHVDCAGDDCCSPSDAGSEEARVSIFIATGSKR